MDFMDGIDKTRWSMSSINLLLNLINRIGKLLTFAYFWHMAPGKYSFAARLIELGKDLFRVVFTPLILLGFLLTSLNGMTFSPYDGRKVYATLERLAYGGGYSQFNRHFRPNLQNAFLAAPDFQPISFKE